MVFPENSHWNVLQRAEWDSAELLDLNPLCARRNTKASPCAMAYISLQMAAAVVCIYIYSFIYTHILSKQETVLTLCAFLHNDLSREDDLPLQLLTLTVYIYTESERERERESKICVCMHVIYIYIVYNVYIYIYIYVHIHTYIHTVQYSTEQYSTLPYITLHYTTLHYITLHYTTLHYITLYYITLHYIH